MFNPQPPVLQIIYFYCSLDVQPTANLFHRLLYIILLSACAVYDRDYQFRNTSVMFMPEPDFCDRIECVRIPIIDDETVDGLNEENFTIALDIDSSLYPNIRLKDTHAVVTIIDIISMLYLHVYIIL